MSTYLDDALSQMLYLLVYGLGIPLLIILICGCTLAIIQSATQVQEQLLTFFPKILIFAAMIYFWGGAFVYLLGEYLKQMIQMIFYLK